MLHLFIPHILIKYWICSRLLIVCLHPEDLLFTSESVMKHSIQIWVLWKSDNILSKSSDLLVVSYHLEIIVVMDWMSMSSQNSDVES